MCVYNKDVKEMINPRFREREITETYICQTCSSICHVLLQSDELESQHFVARYKSQILSCISVVMGGITPPPLRSPPCANRLGNELLFETGFRKVGLYKKPKHHSHIRFPLLFFRYSIAAHRSPPLSPY